MGERKTENLESGFVCHKCQKIFDEICSFTQYGSDARNYEYLEGNEYCEKCFDIIEEEIS